MDAFYRSRIAVVSTRSLYRAAGRPAILKNIIRALEQTNDVTVFPLPSAIERGRTRGLYAVLGQLLKSLVHRRPLPLQCLLYGSRQQCERLAGKIEASAFDAVYLDTVRCYALLALLRRRLPHLHIVTDFDDLMSRRARILAQKRFPLLAGHVGHSLQRWIRLLFEGPLARFITAYESTTLPWVERDVVSQSSATVMLSAVEAEHLRERLPANTASTVHAIPPGFALKAEPWSSPAALRFVFVGGDDLLQNRMAIDHLLALWRKLRPAAPLHIYGRQARRPAPVEGVHWHGFVESTAAIYTPGSIALVPALVKGGIKTKVAEAWAWGCPVLGNDAAFEGYAIRNYPLALPERDWNKFLLQPEAFVDRWLEAARLGHDFIRREMSPGSFAQSWNDIMIPFAERAVQERRAQLRVVAA